MAYSVLKGFNKATNTLITIKNTIIIISDISVDKSSNISDSSISIKALKDIVSKKDFN